MSIDWNWGIFLQPAPFGNTTYLGWIWSGFQVTVALSLCLLGDRVLRRFTVWYFKNRAQSNSVRDRDVLR